MKAIKIASGVAVTALALAISAQANAAAHEMGDTETSWSFTGSMEFLTIIDMAPGDGAVSRDGEAVDTVVDVELDEEGDFDDKDAEDGWGLEGVFSVKHGPFSGGFSLKAEDQGDVKVTLEDIVITDGAISFGQTGSLVDETHEYVYDMDDSKDSLAQRSEGAPVGAALRYTMEGFKVQIEGANRNDAGEVETEINATVPVASDEATTRSPTRESDFGFAVQYSGEAGAISYVAESQFRASALAGDDDEPYTYFGAGVTYTMDIVTAKAAINQYSVTTPNSSDLHDKSVLEYGFEVTVTPIDALSVYVKGMDLDANDALPDSDRLNRDGMTLLFGSAYTAGSLKFTGEYKYTADAGDAEGDRGDEIMARVDYTAGALGVFSEVTLANSDADTANAPLIETGVTYTQDQGVRYAAVYEVRAEETEAIDPEEINRFRLTAGYAF